VVARCISLYAKTTASLPGNHWRKTSRGGRERVTTSALSRTLRRPNSYQSPSDFMLNLVDSLYRHGNAYALGTRNERFEIDELHLMDARQSRPTLIAYDGSLFFQLGGNAIVEKMLERRQIIVPQRDVLHIRLRSGSQWPQPLIGEPPLHAAMSDIAISDAFLDQQMNFLKNRAAPSAVLSTDLILDKDQTQQLRDRWNEQAKGLHSGGVPILTGGLKVQPWTQPAAAKDMQLAELLKLTDERICWAFDIPPQLLALVTTPASST
jgi:HK97 family phage portal protein